MYYSCTCPNCGYHYTPPSVPLNLDWTQWQDITWYDDHGQPLTYPTIHDILHQQRNTYA